MKKPLTVPLGSARVDPRGTVHRTRGVRFTPGQISDEKDRVIKENLSCGKNSKYGEVKIGLADNYNEKSRIDFFYYHKILNFVTMKTNQY